MPVIIVYDGQFGDAGKGKVSEIMADKYDATAVVRVGGSQADHTSISGKVFNVLPTSAGKRVSVLPQGSYIVLSRLRKEMKGIKPDMLLIDEWASCITREDRLEARRSKRSELIGSHGLGIRSAVERRKDRKAGVSGQFIFNHTWLKPYMCNTAWWLREQLEVGKYIIIEGTQGFGLSSHLGDISPYTTSRIITPNAFLEEAGVNPKYVEERIMCLRTYPIRVSGNSGPLINELTWDEVSKRAGKYIIEKSGSTGKVHRVAEFDNKMVHRAISETLPTKIILNMLDYINPKERIDFIEGLPFSVDYVGLDSKSIITTEEYKRELVYK